MRRRATSGECIVCLTETTDREEALGRKEWRCAEWLPCALRRNAGRKRPKPEDEIVAMAERLGHIPPPAVSERAQGVVNAAVKAFRDATAEPSTGSGER